jgi:hypothetical protein
MKLKNKKNKNLQEVNEETKFTDADYPGLYQCADIASQESQKFYYGILISYLVSLIMISMIPLLNLPLNTNNFSLALLFIISLALMIWLVVKKPEESWYNGRAVAESVKTRTWRWMMKADPYNNESEDYSSRLFIQNLKEILKQNEKLGELLGNDSALSKPLSDKMKAIRASGIQERLEYYIKNRILEQSNWYMEKTILNRNRTRFWFIILVSVHFLAIVFLLYQIMDNTITFPIEFLTVCAGAVISWIQTKRYRQLAAAYTLAVHEITLIKYESDGIKDEIRLSEFVINSENAFSREHTQWVARKSN